MAKVERHILINAPVEKVFAYLHDPRTAVEWLPGVVEVKDVTLTEKGVGSRHRWTYRMAGLLLGGESITTEYIHNQRLVTQSKAGLPTTWIYQFEPHNAGTELSLTVEYAFPIPVLGRFLEALMSRQNERVADLAMANIKAKMEHTPADPVR